VSDPAYQAALRLLARRDYFRAELEERLLRKGFTRDEVERAGGRCAELGLVDDGRLAARFAEVRAVQRGWGPHRLEAELKRRGVDAELAETAARLDPKQLRAALAQALRRAEVRAPAGWWRLPARRGRMVSSLLARGFETADAIRAVDELAASRESEHDALDDQ
jgi:regulatory protein